ncbi:MAG TPA: ABC transporter permease subunit [Allosphingosinicella sp.]|nr:ABC transporter permease subunit [Allosphingosinicella sp.]
MKVGRKDWLEFVRDRRLLALAALGLLIATAALATAWLRVAEYEADRNAAVAQEQQTWNNQGARNPHSAAHFAEWAMRPLTAMALLEPGVTPYAGSAIWMEAHNWNSARARPVEDQANTIDLGAFSIAWVLQYLVPLIIFVLAAGLVARERERGTLRLLLANGLPPGRLLRGKLGSLLRFSALLALPVLIVAVAAALIAGIGNPVALALWVLSYTVYIAVIAAFGLAVSALARTQAQALLALTGLWLAALVLVPRAGAALAEAGAPTPAPDAFWANYRLERERRPQVFGRDAEAFKAATLRQYRVGRVEDLPVSLGGLQLDADERIGDEVMDRLYAGLNATYAAQRGRLRISSILSPLPAMQNLSMTFAGTSMPDQIEFQRQAEMHRRHQVRFLNMDMIRNAGAQDFDYLAGEELWRRTPRFTYQPPSTGDMLARALPDALILLGWLAAAILLLAFAARRLAREVR